MFDLNDQLELVWNLDDDYYIDPNNLIVANVLRAQSNKGKSVSRTCFVLRWLSLDCVGHSGGEVRWKIVIAKRLCRPTVQCCQTENEIQQTVKPSECLTYAITRECSVLRRWGLVCVRDSFWGERSKVSIAQYSDYIDSPVLPHIT